MQVSIHAPQEGCDLTALIIARLLYSFNSRTPGGVRPDLGGRYHQSDSFQFTHPRRGATGVVPSELYGTEFQFTHPRRGATELSVFSSAEIDVSIHAPQEGCDTMATIYS